MRSRGRLLLAVAVVAACAGAAAATLFAKGSGPAHGPTPTLRERQAAHETAQRAGKRVVVRGPRGRRGKRGKRGKRGPRGVPGPTGATGPQGSPGAAGTDHAQDLSVNWANGDWPGHDSANVAIDSIGTLAVTCNPTHQQLTLFPTSGSVRTVMTLTTFQGAGSFDNSLNQRFVSNDGSPIVVSSTMPNQPFPVNGMINGTLSVEPIAGDGGTGPPPATLTLSSYLKVNDPTPANDFCFVSAQVLRGA